MLLIPILVSIFLTDLTMARSRSKNLEPISILVSVGEFGPQDLEWRKEICQRVHKVGNSLLLQGVEVNCRKDQIQIIDTFLQQLRTQNQYHIRLLRGYNGSYRVSVTQWNRKLDSDATTLSWNVGSSLNHVADKDAGLDKILKNFFDYLNQEQNLKTNWLRQALFNSENLIYDLKAQTFKAKKTGKALSLNSAAEIFEQESQINYSYLQSRQEIALIFSIKSSVEKASKRSEDMSEILDMALKTAKDDFNPWQKVIRVDERGLSDMTLQLLDKNPIQYEDSSPDMTIFQGFGGIIEKAVTAPLNFLF